MSEIALNSGIRTSLSSLKSTSSLLEKTTERLSTGKKVASAVDNPTNYFAAENYNDAASALDARLDSMSESVQRINAADNGVTSMKAYLSQMKGIVNDAMSNTDAGERRSLGEQFNELVTQIRDTAQDSDYGGINLLYNNASTTVEFAEGIGESTLELKGFNISAASGEVDANGEIAASGVSSGTNAYALTFDASGSDVVGIKSAGASDPEVEYATDFGTAVDSVTSTAATYATNDDFTAKAATLTAIESAIGDAITEANNIAGSEVYSWDSSSGLATSGTDGSDVSTEMAALLQDLDDVYDAVVATTEDSGNAGEITDAEATAVTTATEVVTTATTGTKDVFDAKVESSYTSADDWEIDWGGDDYQTTLNSVISSIEDMESALSTQASKLANNLAIITERQDFTQNRIDILETGADNLTLADMDEEGANLLALQTSSSLATQALSIASSQAQNVLQILR
jgi:flagellin-like hook-associated protein FlgL